MALDHRSEEKLLGVRPELVHVIREAAKRTKFRVTEGLRDPERQKMLVAQRKSKTLNSRHISGHAIDFIAIGEDGIATYDEDDMKRVAAVMKEVAAEQGVKVQWGGDWPGAWDMPHLELDRKAYPANVVSPTTRAIEVAKAPPGAAATGAAVAVGAVTAVPSLPSLPSPPDLSSYSAWKSFGTQAGELFGWFSGNLVLTAACASVVAFFTFLPRIAQRLPWLRSYLSS